MTRLSIILAAGISALAFTAAAQAADLIIEEPVIGVVDVGSDWEGGYIGGHVGYGWGDSDHVGETIGDMEMAGFLVGAQIGYNFALTEGLIVGLQGDISWADITGEYTGVGPDITDTINATGSLTAHLGFDGGAFMPYVLAGVAFANSERTSSIGPTTETQLHTGWTVGAGINLMVADNVSAFVEGRYSDYGTAEYTTLPSSPEVSLIDTSIRAGFNFHF